MDDWLDTINAIQFTSLSCMQNIFLFINISEIGRAEDIWKEIIVKESENGVKKKDLELFLSSISLMQTFLYSSSRSSTISSYFHPLTVQALFHFSSITSWGTEDGLTEMEKEKKRRKEAEEIFQIRITCLQILNLFAKFSEDENFLMQYGTHLIQRMSQNAVITDLEVAEILNGIFDVFAEVKSNGLFVRLGMLPLLESNLPFLTQKIQREKKEMDQYTFDRLDESRLNLKRFISYKKKQF
eukprot:TRINITY_DN5249_c0_g1_i1.p1 TRINITY_DN5249_c0_g1~~TRINITY_DN5249_c0_g1_i1.p1  ORF type:complete len:241 (-),score=57.27 TRINITY_DN5249_c0_g1_i1:87-809(-)